VWDDAGQARASNSDEDEGSPAGGDDAAPSQQPAASGAVKQRLPSSHGITKRFSHQTSTDKLWGGRLIISSEDNVFVSAQ
jgi:hypothetical protein